MLYFYVIITSNGLIRQSMTCFRNSITNLLLYYIPGLWRNHCWVWNHVRAWNW